MGSKRPPAAPGAVPLADAGEESKENTFLASMGAIVTRLPHVPYEDSLRVEFQFSLPNTLLDVPVSDSEAEPCPPDAGVVCMWERQLQFATKTLQAALGGEGDQQRDPSSSLVQSWSPNGKLPVKRSKRGFWSIAAAAIPLVTEYFPKLMSLFRLPSAEPEAETAVVKYSAQISPKSTDLSSQLAKLHTDFQKFKSELLPTKQNTSKDKQMQTDIQYLQLVMRGFIEINALDQALSVCNENLLPARLVKLPHLKAAIRQVQIKLDPSGAEPVIPDQNVTYYYNLRSAKCRLEGEKFKIDFHIPIKRRGEKLALFHLHPAPFKVRDVICYLLREPLTVAMVNDRPFFLPASYCEEGEFFCSLPRDSNPSELDACLHPFFP